MIFKRKIYKRRLVLLAIVGSYFVVSSLYIIFSDKFLIYFFRNDPTNVLFDEIQSYKGISFIFLTAIVLFLILKKRDAIIEKYINNKTRYYNLFNNTLNGVIYTTIDGEILAINKACLDIFNVTEEQVIEKSIYDLSSKLVDENLTPIVLDNHPVKNAINTKKAVSNIIVGYVKPKSNTYTWLKINCIPEFMEEYKDPYRICITIDDISLLKNNQKELEKTQEEIKKSLHKVALSEFLLKEANVMAKIGVYEINSKKDDIKLSDEIYRIFNIPIEEEYPFEIVRKSFKEQSKNLLNKVVKECMEKGNSFDVVLEIELRVRPTVWVRVIGKPIYDENNEIIGRRGIVQDISESIIRQDKIEQSKKELEKSFFIIKRSEILLKEAGRLAKIGAYELLTETGEYYWSDELYIILGVEKGGKLPSIKNIFNLFIGESKVKLLAAVNNLTNNNIPFELELELINFHQEHLWIHVIAHPVFNESNEVVGRRGVLQNITNYKKVQLELELSKIKLEASLELVNKNKYLLKEASRMANIGYWGYENKTETLIWSDFIHKAYGTDPKEGAPKFEEILKVLDDESKEKLTNATLELTNNGVPYDIEIKATNYKNEEIWFRSIARPVFDKNKKVTGRIGVLQSITDSKNAQIALELSKKQLEASLETVKANEFILKEASKMANIGYWSADVQTGKITWSEVIYQIYGLASTEETPKFEDILPLFDKESKEKLIKATLDLTNNGVPYDIETKAINLKNQEVWVRTIAEPVYDEDHKIIARRGVLQNITASKKTQLELEHSKNKLEASLNLMKENEYLLKEAGRMANIGYWGYDMLTDTNIWSEPIYKIYGVNPKDGVPELNGILSVFDDKSKKKLLKAMLNLANDGVSFDIDLEMTNFKNEKKWIRNIGEPIYNTQHKVIGRKGVVQDITEPRKIMAQIDETEKMYRLLADNANDLICLHETDSTLVYLSPSIKDLLGYNRSELLGKPIFELIYKEDVLPLKKAIEERVFKDVDAEAFVFRIRHKKGHFIWLETLATSITKDNEIVSYVSSSRDITPWVLAKQEIQENQALLQKLTTEITLIEEKQKKEIATNIHDHLSQSLVISKMRINELKRNPVFKKVGKDLLFIEKHISEALENSRKITYELSPPVLYQLGIIDALNWLLDNIETTHKIKCELNCNVIHIKLSDVKAILLYRSIQEVVMNSIKYAKASSINLTIDKTDSEIQISIRDNGVGFDITTLNRKHHNKESDLGSGLGLFTIKERIRNIQGEFSILSEINVGTTAKIVVPLTQ